VLAMLLYAIGIMYTPGPVNLLSFNLGLNRKFRASIPFFISIGVSMLLMFLIFGYTGERFIKKEYLIYISIAGALYILYLAVRLLLSNVKLGEPQAIKPFSFRDGFLMQAANPKAILATLPIATINYPANDIRGLGILFVSLGLAVLACGAPASYALVGTSFGALLRESRFLRVFDMVMGLLLIYVAYSILHDHVYLVLTGAAPY
jgi:threonine/homoserine/homoserine lactone efflux protein